MTAGSRQLAAGCWLLVAGAGDQWTNGSRQPVAGSGQQTKERPVRPWVGGQPSAGSGWLDPAERLEKDLQLLFSLLQLGPIG